MRLGPRRRRKQPARTQPARLATFGAEEQRGKRLRTSDRSWLPGCEGGNPPCFPPRHARRSGFRFARDGRKAPREGPARHYAVPSGMAAGSGVIVFRCARRLSLACNLCGASRRIPLRHIHSFERFHELTESQVVRSGCPVCGQELQIPGSCRSRTGESVVFDPENHPGKAVIHEDCC